MGSESRGRERDADARGRSRPEVSTSLGVGSLKPLAPRVRGIDAYSRLLDQEPTPLDTERPGSNREAVPADAKPGQILALEQCGATVRVLRVARPPGFTFQPGQYLKVGIPGGKREDFSIASAPHDEYLEMAIELREGGRVTPALFGLRVGDEIGISAGAKGKLQLDSSASDHLMVATVTGVAPLLSMVRDAFHRGTSATFTIILGASFQAELPFHGELTALADVEPQFTYLPTVSRPDEPANRSWRGEVGRADAVARSLAARFDPGRTHVYAVGHAGMIQAVVRDFGGLGFAVSTESYGG